MTTDFYRSTAELLPTFSLLLAASLTLPAQAPKPLCAGASGRIYHLPACMQHAYYKPVALDQNGQLQALGRFVNELLSNTEDNPQPVANLLNDRFWDLV